MITIGNGHCENPNTSWLGSRGMWITYVVFILLLHLFLISIPFWSIPVAWTVTNLLHNTINFIVLHLLKGAPWELQDQGSARYLTHWEQIDYGIQYTNTRKFLMCVPVGMFFLTSFYTNYNPIHFLINFLSLLFVFIPKLPTFHMVRLFGINKY